jgi:hypothetical protein
LKAVRAVVRPTQRGEYLECWSRYAALARALGAVVRLLEDQALPGRFLELTEHTAAEGMASALDSAAREADLRRRCVRREGDDLLYREVPTADSRAG